MPLKRVFVYVVRYDCGFAPNPFYGFCTLAACKPGIRGSASVGDMVIGIGSRQGPCPDKLIYAMRVDEIVSYQEYWEDPRFDSKAPTYVGTYKQAFGDRVYHRDVNQNWIQENSHHSSDDGSTNLDHVKRDTKADKVIISETFSYFGDAARQVPVDLNIIPQGRRGYSVITDSTTIGRIDSWIAGLPSGCVGRPTDWP